MKSLWLAGAAMLWQMVGITAKDTPQPRDFRYERMVTVARGTTGQACAPMDASLFAHAGSESLNDLRLYALPKQSEVPFRFSVNGTQSDDDATAKVTRAAEAGGDLVFDLQMPQRPYSAVNLLLKAKDFLATAVVTGSSGADETGKNLGTFALFDLSGEHLARLTTLALPESTFANLHVVLHIAPSAGAGMREFPASIVQGASVPPSREAQTLFTAVAGTNRFVREGTGSAATIHVAAHVPVERVAFQVDPTYAENFAREVVITATPDGAHDASAVETVRGEISHVRLPEKHVDAWAMTVDAPLGVNTLRGATVRVAVEGAAIPLTAVVLEMRQRKICFDATPATPSYEVLYGDPMAGAPAYGYAQTFLPALQPAAAVLGAERMNPAFVPGVDERPFLERHPEVIWLGLVALALGSGSRILHRSRMRRG